MVVRLETNNGRKSLGLNRRKQSLPNHLITTNRKRTRFCHVLLMRNSLAPFKRICTISDHWGAYLILSICQKLAMEIMATNLPPTQLFSTEISTNCSSQPSIVQWLSSSIFPFCSLFVRPSRYGNIRPNLHFYFP